MKTTLLLATLLASTLPSLAAAACGGHDQVTMSCTDGTVWDEKTQACVSSTS